MDIKEFAEEKERLERETANALRSVGVEMLPGETRMFCNQICIDHKGMSWNDPVPLINEAESMMESIISFPYLGVRLIDLHPDSLPVGGFYPGTCQSSGLFDDS